MADSPRDLIAATLKLLDEAEGAASHLEESSSLGATLQAIRTKLTDLREASLAIGEENLAFKERVRTLEASFAKREELVRHKGVYWVRGDPDPWCPVCWEKDQMALHMARTDILAGRLCQCPQCGYNANLDNVYPPREWQDDD